MGKIRTAIYHKADGTEVEVKYDEDSPCLICGEPVIGASMGGTVICGSCDCGRCRYCGTTVFVYKKEIDGGDSKKRVLRHMEWHHKNTPEIVEKYNSSLRNMLNKFEEERKIRKQKELIKNGRTKKTPGR